MLFSVNSRQVNSGVRLLSAGRDMNILIGTLLATISILNLIPFTSSIRAGHACIASQKSDWQILAPTGEEFAVLMPPLSDIYIGTRYIDRGPNKAHTVKVRIYRALTDHALFVVQSYETSDPKDLVEDLIKNNKSISLGQEVKLNGLKGKAFSREKLSIFGRGKYFINKNHLYIIEAVRRDGDDPSIADFLDSFNLERSNSATNFAVQSLTKSDTILSNKESSRKAIILWRGYPTYTPESRANGETGKVSLKALLSPDGRVKDIQVVSGLKYGLNEQAIEAAKEIIFLPAEMDGKYVSQWILIEYTFNMY
jgi:TonB family protein